MNCEKEATYNKKNILEKEIEGQSEITNVIKKETFTTVCILFLYSLMHLKYLRKY